MQAEKEEEEAFRKMMMAKFAEDDWIKQMNDQKRRMKQLEHKREVEKMMENRRQQRETDKVQTTLCVFNYIQNQGALVVFIFNTFKDLTDKVALMTVFQYETRNGRSFDEFKEMLSQKN